MRSPTTPYPVIERLAAATVGRAGGLALAGLFGVTARLRGTRALHPVGICGTGSLESDGGPPTGVTVLDETGPRSCRVRWSRSTGRRQGLDIEGLAVSIDGPSGGDVLFASTGTGVITRHVLTVRDRSVHGSLTTLLPLSTRHGPLLLRLDPTSAGDPPRAYDLLVAAPGGPWSPRGRLTLEWDEGDCTRRHDPVGRPPEGAWVHPFLARLRDPSYVTSQQVPADVREPA